MVAAQVAGLATRQVLARMIVAVSDDMAGVDFCNVTTTHVSQPAHQLVFSLFSSAHRATNNALRFPLPGAFGGASFAPFPPPPFVAPHVFLP